jgi:hypothetical protein
MFAPIPLPGSRGPVTDRVALAADIDAWLRSAAMNALVTDFGGALPHSSIATMLSYLEDFSARHWDFRRGGERPQAQRQQFTSHRSRTVVAAAVALGIGAPASPPRERYDHLLVLGGLAAACLGRTAFAATLLDHGIAHPQVSALSGFRPLTTTERHFLVQHDEPDAEYEVDAMAAGVRRAFQTGAAGEVDSGGDPGRDPARAWCVRRYRAAAGVPVSVVAAPSSQPDVRRANTADTCRFWAERVAELRPHARILVATSALYVPFQHFDAVASFGLPYDCIVDTIGFAATELAEDSADRCLQEIRSAILSLRRLYALALGGAHGEAFGGGN